MEQNPNNKRFLLVWLCVLYALFLTGCWSSREIEDLSLLPGVAIDIAELSVVEKELTERGGGYPKNDLITLTFQVIPPQLAGSGKKEGASQQKPYLNISETGDSIHQSIREVALRSERVVFSQHLKVIVLGEDLVRSVSMEKILDQYFRDNGVRPSCLVFISKGRASETLESKQPGDIPAFHLLGIVDNRFRSSRLLPPITLAKLSGKLPAESSFLLQTVLSANGEVKFAGAAVINGKSKKLGGFLNESELEGLIWLTGEGKGGVLKTVDPKTGQLIMYEIESMKSKIIPHVKGGKMSFDVKIESEGRISENWANKGNPTDSKFVKMVEETAQKEVKQLVTNVLEKMQKEYRTDVAGFGTRLKMENPKVWEKVKEDWDEQFSKIPINLDAKITITDYGAASK
ncbi:Ger(x)C family spore germination protein [Risungbinella massiliensis]|uniref:Ger(x)C family spore germination protein n=1 Tax=Risungbinella massiliensis TaxID=1329796 RepID=UPI0005CBC690|nr:Ger(x)C family spore germination protein [Risungbinella massiliensis]